MTKRKGANQLGKKIRNLRHQLGLTQEQLGERANIHYSYVGQMERGDKMPSLQTLKRIATALSTDLQHLLEEPAPYEPSQDPSPDTPAELHQLLQGRSPAEIRFCIDLVRVILQFLNHRRPDL